jgi:bacterioferritin-associated ferredoxin
MFVCVCHAVSDRVVKCAIEGGATSREEVTRACRAGGDCGACHQMIEDMIEDHTGVIPASGLVRGKAA